MCISYSCKQLYHIASNLVTCVLSDTLHEQKVSLRYNRGGGNTMPQKISGPALLESLHWRYATKIFDASKKISDPDWKCLEDALVLTPSSYGLQPWKFLVIKDTSVLQKLLPLSWNQKQVVDCSHYVVFLAKTDITPQDVDSWIERMAEVRQISKNSISFFRDMMVGDLVKGPRHAWIHQWAAHQTYIALGNFMTCAALMGIDACPMEGIDPVKYDETLGLKGSGFNTVVACAAGYRAVEDKYAHLPKIRYAKDKIIQKI